MLDGGLRFVRRAFNVAKKLGGAIVYGTHGFALAYPLPLVLAASLFPLDLNWRWLIFAVLAGIASIAIYMMSAMITVEMQRLNGIAQFKLQYAHSTFIRMKVSDYLPALQRPHAPSLTPRSLMREPSSAMFYGVQPRYSLTDDDNVQVFRIVNDPTRGPGVSSLVAYPGMTDTTIFTTDAPDSIGPLRRFMMLHEIGHASWSGRMQNTLSHIGALTPVVAVPFLLAGTRLSILGIATVLALGVIAIKIQRGGRLTDLRRSHLYDEVAADCFALHNSDPAWFRGTPEQVAGVLSGDLNMSDEQRQVRRQILTDNLHRLQRGDQPTHPMDLTIPDTPLHEFLIPILLIAIGLLHATLTTPRLAILGVITLFYVLLWVLLYLICALQEHRLGVGAPDNVFRNTPIP